MNTVNIVGFLMFLCLSIRRLLARYYQGLASGEAHGSSRCSHRLSDYQPHGNSLLFLSCSELVEAGGSRRGAPFES